MTLLVGKGLFLAEGVLGAGMFVGWDCLMVRWDRIRDSGSDCSNAMATV